MVKIAPSILSADFANLKNEIVALEKAGADMIHIDVMDGHYVPNLTFGPAIVRVIRDLTNLPLDVHLMVEKPETMIHWFTQAGADILTVHAEACKHLDATLNSIKEQGCKAGVSLNPATSENVLTYVLDKVDQVLVMSVNPGFGGQSFIPSAINKIAQVAKIIDQHKRSTGHEIFLEVDGGVKVNNIGAIAAAGADTFVAGSAIFGQKSKAGYQQVISEMREAIDESLIALHRAELAELSRNRD